MRTFVRFGGGGGGGGGGRRFQVKRSFVRSAGLLRTFAMAPNCSGREVAQKKKKKKKISIPQWECCSFPTYVHLHLTSLPEYVWHFLKFFGYGVAVKRGYKIAVCLLPKSWNNIKGDLRLSVFCLEHVLRVDSVINLFVFTLPVSVEFWVLPDGEWITDLFHVVLWSRNFVDLKKLPARKPVLLSQRVVKRVLPVPVQQLHRRHWAKKRRLQSKCDLSVCLSVCLSVSLSLSLSLSLTHTHTNSLSLSLSLTHSLSLSLSLSLSRSLFLSLSLYLSLSLICSPHSMLIALFPCCTQPGHELWLQLRVKNERKHHGR